MAMDVDTGARFSAFGGLINTPVYTLLDSIPLYGLDAELFGTDTQGSGTVTDDLLNSATKLAVTSGATDYAKIRSHEHFRYQAGKGQRVIQSMWTELQSIPANQVLRWGLFDDNDGVFWEATSDGLFAVVRSSTSGVPIDNRQRIPPTNKLLSKGNIYDISFQWLGVGNVTFCLNEKAVYTFIHPNTLAAPYMKTANLQVSAEIINSGASEANELHVICNHVRSEGGDTPPSKPFAIQNSAFIGLPTNDTPTPLLSIRLASTFNTVENRMLAFPTACLSTIEGGRTFILAYLNGSLTGPSWTAANANSGVEYDESATAITGGELIFSGATDANNGVVEFDLEKVFGIGKRSLNTYAFGAGGDILTIVGVRRNSTPDIVASLVWDEVR